MKGSKVIQCGAVIYSSQYYFDFKFLDFEETYLLKTLPHSYFLSLRVVLDVIFSSPGACNTITLLLLLTDWR